MDKIEVEAAELDGALTAADVVDLDTGEVVVEANVELTADRLHKVLSSGAASFEVFFPERDDVGNIITNTLKRDSVRKPEEALIEIYRKLRPGDPPTLDTATALFEGMFFDARKYDFSRVGRLKFNIKLYENQDATGLDHRTLTPEDFYATIRYLLKLRKNIGMVDDIDHLGNRRVRAVGELMENQFRIGLVRMERAIKEKMSVYQELSTAMPHDLINAKPVMAAIREFFGSSQLSQFMDQTNPLSEITHKRRLSALGPGGLSRERAGFEVRDVHPTHYGRICPIETPEGPNIGLISSLSCFARINEYGFIESPYRKVKDSRILDYVEIVNAGESGLRVGDHIEKEEAARLNARTEEGGQAAIDHIPFSFYLSAWEEDKHTIAQANIEFNDKGEITEDLVNARRQGNFVLVNRAEVDYIDVSPKQLVSVAASLVPFLEHDDANRALMGANMQRQSCSAAGGRGAAGGHGHGGRDGARLRRRDPGQAQRHRGFGGLRAHYRARGGRASSHAAFARGGIGHLQLIKFKRSNQNTCINQKPVVREGDRVVKGQVIADGPCTEQGELALGRNVLVAFMPWRGYNFEDAILISEKLVREDYYTSVHIEEFEIEARDTKLGPEEITRDIPNVSEHALRDLDESGVIRIGAQIKHGDILVGKVTPKGETQLTPEEKLLRAIFGEKAGDVRDASLTCPPGIEGTVVDVRIFSRKGQEKDERAKLIEGEYVAKLEKNLGDEIRILTDERLKRLEGILGSKEVLADLHDERTNKRLLTKGAILDRETIERISTKNLKRIRYADKDPRVNEQIDEIEEMTSRQIEVLRKITNEKVAKLQKGDELPPGVIKLVKVYVAMKRKLSVGDKMAGRHGNKGVIARILPEEDMPYLPDGTPVEIVLNPLGVPSRMNVGQILETHLGWAAHALGKKIADLIRANTDAAYTRELMKKEFAGTATLRQLLELDDEMLLARGGRHGARHLVRDRGLRRRAGGRDQGAAGFGRSAFIGQDGALRRHDRRAVRAAGDGGLHLHAQALAPGGRQDSRALHRAVLADYAAAAGRQGAVRRAALRRNGSVGAGSIWRGVHPAGTADREVGRRLWPDEDLRSHREGRGGHRAGRAGVVQRADPRIAVAVPGRGIDQARGPGAEGARAGSGGGGRLKAASSCQLLASSLFGDESWHPRRSKVFGTCWLFLESGALPLGNERFPRTREKPRLAARS